MEKTSTGIITSIQITWTQKIRNLQSIIDGLHNNTTEDHHPNEGHANEDVEETTN